MRGIRLSSCASAEMLQRWPRSRARYEAQTLADARGATLRSRWELLKRLWRPSGD